MEKFRTYSPEDIVLSNLDETANRLAAVFEQELAHLTELAKELTENKTEEKTFLSMLPELQIPESKFDEKSHLAQNLSTLQRLERLHTVEKRLLLAKALCKQSNTIAEVSLMDLYDDSEKSEIHTDQRIVYQKNSFTDSAYLRFAKLYAAPRAMYAHSYLSACEDVFNGVADFCILPLENTSEGRLISFLRLIDRFGLKIVATCDIPGAEGNRSTCFAILSKYFDIDIKIITSSRERFLEISYQIDLSTPTVAEILSAAQLCGLSLSKVHAFPTQSDHEMNGQLYHTVFKIDNQSDPTTFLVYLAMELPQHTLVGIYPHF